MSVRALIDFPQLRIAAPHVVAGLREVDPTAEIVYFGRGRWLLGSVRPSTLLREPAERVMRSALRMLDIALTNPRFTFNPSNARRLFGRVDFAVLALQGFRFVHEYRVQGELTSAIVEDFRKADYMYRTLSDEQVDELLNAPKAQQIAAARAQIRDPARGRDAWRYGFTLNIAPGHSLTPQPRRSSAKTLIRSIA